MFRELGAEPSALAVAKHYRDLLTGFVLDAVDAEIVPAVEALGMAARAMPTLMVDPAQRAPVARDTLAFAATLL
jgi:LPPG:FO 2-phospho-L-lactate transferase